MTAAPPPVPPTEVVYEQPQSTWPTVIGIICIVFGGFGILGGLWGAVVPFLMSTVASMMPDPAGTMDASFAAVTRYRAITIPVSVISAVVAALLLVGGIQLLRRRFAARRVLLIWAIIKIFLVVAAVMVNIPMQRAQLEAQQAQGMPAMPMMNLIGPITAACGVVFGWALPIFILIWLMRRPIRDEIEAW